MNNIGLKYDIEQVLREHGYKRADVEIINSDIEPYVVIKAKYEVPKVNKRFKLIYSFVIGLIFLIIWTILK